MPFYYYAIKKDGETSYLKKKVLETALGGDRRMVRSCNPHGREQGKAVQSTCEARFESAFLTAMHSEGTKRVPPSYDPLQLTQEHPARLEHRRKLQAEHVRQVKAQWKRSAEAAGLTATRTHFVALVRQLEARHERIRTEQERMRPVLLARAPPSPVEMEAHEETGGQMHTDGNQQRQKRQRVESPCDKASRMEEKKEIQ